LRTPGGGVMCINWGAGIHRIEDGSSNTVMLAEVRTGSELSPADPRGTWALGVPGASVICSPSWDDTTPNTKADNSDDCEGCINRPQLGMGAWPGCPFQQAMPRSRHTGGVNVAMGDASVRFVRDSISNTNWFYMMMRNDGQIWADCPPTRSARSLTGGGFPSRSGSCRRCGRRHPFPHTDCPVAPGATRHEKLCMTSRKGNTHDPVHCDGRPARCVGRADRLQREE